MLTNKFPRLKGLILDMDGVLWHDTQAIGNLPAIFNTISELGLRFVFGTNNATKTAVEYQRKLRGFGLEIQAEHIITSAAATALYLKNHFAPGTCVYVVGSASLKQVLLEQGFKISVRKLDLSWWLKTVRIGSSNLLKIDSIVNKCAKNLVS